MSLVLASQSPRRRELLATLGVEFTTLSADIDETPLANEDPIAYVKRLGLSKAHAGFALANNAQAWVLGSDTTVVVEQRILEKPVSKDDFVDMMTRLSGRSHQVYTSIALVGQSQDWVEAVTTEVQFIELTAELIEAYWATGEPCDKAGGYGIQGFGSVLVQEIRGSHSNVVGLPLRETAQLLGQAGLPIWQGSVTLK